MLNLVEKYIKVYYSYSNSRNNRENTLNIPLFK